VHTEPDSQNKPACRVDYPSPNPGGNFIIIPSGPGKDGNPCDTPTTDNPIVIGTGNKVLQEIDYAGVGASTLGVVRTYNSATTNRAQYDLAPQWSISIKRAFVA